LKIEWDSAVTQSAEVLVDEHQYQQATIGEGVPVWTLADGRARLVSQDAVIPWFLWLLLALVLPSLVGLWLIFRAAMRPSPCDLANGSPGVLEAARIGRRAARSMVFDRRPEADQHEN
jgi:hypothetical protein